MSILYDKIDKPIVFFDIETTGIDIKNDRIIEICAIKYRPDRTKLTLHKYFNPGRESQPMALEAHGLTTEFLSKYSSFEESAEELFDFFKDSDLGGYNCISFDIPLLYEEFARCGKYLSLQGLSIIDSYNLLNKFETRKLNDIYKRYFGQDIDGAHGAEADIEATIKVFEKQITSYGLEETSIKDISKIIRSTSKNEFIVDLSGWFRHRDGEFYFGKGKHKDSLVSENLDYLKWMYENDNLETNSRIVGKLLYDKFSKVQ
jgi:DNA polymerase-3 subunit epsilon